ncbi:MAG TPA: HAMP domain-containing sensor histidine kinase, partial [Erysipelothrix sp.]|nr:HAMP domain-containing sensor histidine kinase [Erysipelothrix sp.]
MPLTQQLFFMVVLLAVFLISFFFGFMTVSVDTFVEAQMYSVIHENQKGIMENYLLGKTGSSLFGAQISDMIHVIYSDNENVPLISVNENLDELFPGITDDLEKHLALDINEIVDFRHEKSSLVSINKINDNSTIVSIMPIEYHNEYKTSLLNTFVYIIIMVIGAVFLLLLYWVGNIIHPLNQIKEYIQKRKNNEEATLNIDRQDEIGELAQALIDMQEELAFQERQKEEMLQNVSHDLKTPVATIKSYSEAIKDGIYPYETLEKSVDVIIEHAERLEKKIYSLLMLNRIDYMTHEELHTLEKIHLKPVLEDVLLSIKQIRPEIDIIPSVHSDLFYGEEEPWRVVIENLLDNAIRYAKTKVEIVLDDHYLSVYNDGEKVSEKRLNTFFKAYE